MLLIRILCLIAVVFSGQAWSATITSTANGNWNAGGTWVGGVAPGSGDRAVINHNVTVTANQTVGDAPVSDTAVVTVASGQTLTLNSGTTFTVRGGMAIDGVVTQNGNVAANGAVGQVYTWKIGTVNNSPNAHWVALGTSGTHISLIVAASSCIVRFDDALGNINTGYFDAQYLDVVRLGDATRKSWNPSLGASGMTFSLQDGSCNTCGDIGTQVVGDGSIFRIKNFTFLNSVGLLTYTGGGPYTSGIRVIDGSVFDTQVHLYTTIGITVTGTLFGAGYDFIGVGLTLFDGNLIANTGAGGVSTDFNVSNSYFLAVGALINPHYLTSLGSAGLTIDGNIFEMPDGTDSTGDCITYSNSGSVVSHIITNNIMLPNSTGGDSGTASSLLGGLNVTISSYEHNTYYGQQGFTIGETYAGHTNNILSFKNNIAWHVTANTGRKLSYDRGQSIPGLTDYILSANAHHNGGFNLQAGSNLKGYDNLAFSSGSPGANDVVNVDPQFVNSSTGIKAWDTSLGGPGTTANAIAKLKLRNLAGYNSAYSIAALLAKVKADMTPKNSAYHVATDNVSPSLGWLGAVPGISSTCGRLMLMGVGC